MFHIYEEFLMLSIVLHAVFSDSHMCTCVSAHASGIYKWKVTLFSAKLKKVSERTRTVGHLRTMYDHKLLNFCFNLDQAETDAEDDETSTNSYGWDRPLPEAMSPYSSSDKESLRAMPREATLELWPDKQEDYRKHIRKTWTR